MIQKWQNIHSAIRTEYRHVVFLRHSEAEWVPEKPPYPTRSGWPLRELHCGGPARVLPSDSAVRHAGPRCSGHFPLHPHEQSRQAIEKILLSQKVGEKIPPRSINRCTGLLSASWALRQLRGDWLVQLDNFSQGISGVCTARSAAKFLLLNTNQATVRNPNGLIVRFWNRKNWTNQWINQPSTGRSVQALSFSTIGCPQSFHSISWVFLSPFSRRFTAAVTVSSPSDKSPSPRTTPPSSASSTTWSCTRTWAPPVASPRSSTASPCSTLTMSRTSFWSSMTTWWRRVVPVDDL